MVTETEHLIFRPSPIHGTGAFAKVPLAAGTLVVEYVGDRITAEKSIERCRQGNHYIFRLSENVHLDGNVDRNPARYINHSCAPNCEAQLIADGVWLVAVRHIQEGEEIVFDYGYDLEDFRAHPCRCGAPGCVGYILAAELRSSIPPADGTSNPEGR